LHGDGWKGRDIMFNTMLVDDNFLIMQLVESKLQDQFPSMEITEAADGAEALQKIESHPPNLIFMDIQLPKGNGLELTRMIKADHPDIIIIIFTNHDSQEYREAAIRYKADYFFPKSSIIASNEIFTLLKSILVEEGFGTDGSAN
jgi:two-component system, response regulator YesN